MPLRTDEYFRGINELKAKLDKIIELLEIRNSIYNAQHEMKIGGYAQPACTCNKKGQTSAVEICPLHDLPQQG